MYGAIALGQVPIAAKTQTAFVVCSPRSVKVIFPEAISTYLASADLASWTISAASATPVAVAALAIDTYTVTLTTSEHQADGLYVLTVPAGLQVGGWFRPDPEEFVYVGVGEAPFLVMVRAVDPRTIQIFFSEDVSEADAEIIANYVFTGPNTVRALSVSRLTAQSFQLTTTEHLRAGVYTLYVDNVRDDAGNPT